MAYTLLNLHNEISLASTSIYNSRESATIKTLEDRTIGHLPAKLVPISEINHYNEQPIGYTGIAVEANGDPYVMNGQKSITPTKEPAQQLAEESLTGTPMGLIPVLLHLDVTYADDCSKRKHTETVSVSLEDIQKEQTTDIHSIAVSKVAQSDRQTHSETTKIELNMSNSDGAQKTSSLPENGLPT